MPPGSGKTAGRGGPATTLRGVGRGDRPVLGPTRWWPWAGAPGRAALRPPATDRQVRGPPQTGPPRRGRGSAWSLRLPCRDTPLLERQKPSACRASSDGASRTRTGDLLGAIRACGAFELGDLQGFWRAARRVTAVRMAGDCRRLQGVCPRILPSGGRHPRRSRARRSHPPRARRPPRACPVQTPGVGRRGVITPR
jgi:hypothetical protein